MNLWEKNDHRLVNIIRLERRRGVAREANKKRPRILAFPRANHKGRLPGYWAHFISCSCLKVFQNLWDFSRVLYLGSLSDRKKFSPGYNKMTNSDKQERNVLGLVLPKIF